MTTFKQVRLTPEHCESISHHLSIEDIRELVAADRLHSESACPSDIENVLIDAPLSHSYAIIGSSSKFVYAVGGVTFDGCVWFVTTSHIGKGKCPAYIRKEFLSRLKDNLDHALRVHARIENYVWSGNRKHVALLRHLGAIFGGPVVHPATGEEFIPFHFERY